MKNVNNQEGVSNYCFYLSPNSFSTVLFEKELKKNNIEFIKDDLGILQPYIVFSVLNKDLETATKILDKIQQDEYKLFDLLKQKRKTKRKAERRTYKNARFMKKLIITGVVLFCNCVVFSQNTGYTKSELSLYKFENKEFVSIIDSIVSYSERCEGEGLKFLNFMLYIRETELNYYQIHITLIDCQGMNFLLTTKNKSKAIGYFVYRNKDFIICGCRYLNELFIQTGYKKMFTAYDSKNLLGIDYTDWDYTFYAPSNKFEMISFNPICVEVKNRIFPICNDSINMIRK
jgi:hypothetical protein